jgi:hypothetical protein
MGKTQAIQMRLKRKKLFTSVAVLSLIVGYVCFSIYTRKQDHPRRTVLDSILFRQDTQYGLQYSEKNFSRVQQEMSREEVCRLLGEPLRIVEDAGGRTIRQIDYVDGKQMPSYPDLAVSSDAQVTRRIVYYSLPGKRADNWHVRAVVFSGDDKVIETHKTFYTD